ncbi:MAG: SpaA isopeptide-forming pilin-related protein [Acutalibacteraceae bacterium]
MTTIKKKMISGVALLCTLMLLIGILPISVFRNNKANAAGTGDYKLRIVYPNTATNNIYYSSMYIHAWDSSGNSTSKDANYPTNTPVQMDKIGHVYEINTTFQIYKFLTTSDDRWSNQSSDSADLNWEQADGKTLTVFSDTINDYSASKLKYISPSTTLYQVRIDFSAVGGIPSDISNNTSIKGDNNSYYYTENENDVCSFDYFFEQYNSVTLSIHNGYDSARKIAFNNLDWNQASIKNNIHELNIKVTALSGDTPTFEYGASSVAGETLYIIGNNITKPTVTFYNENGDEITEGLFNVETVISGNLTNYNDSGNRSYSVVIPEGATQVSFDGGTTKLDLSNYNTSTSNAYNITSSSWISYTEPDLQGSTLYIDTADSSYTAPIKITYGGQTYTMTNVSGTTYRYKFLSSGLLPTKNTPIKISSGTNEVTLYYNPNVTDKNLFNLKDNNWGQYAASYSGRVYFDATLSKLSYQGTIDSWDYGIPESGGTVYCWASDSNSSGGQRYTMTKISGSDIYYADLPTSYKYVTFAGFSLSSINNYGGHGESTSVLEIPTDLSNPCFYADTSDSVIYDGGNRDGYWDEVNSIRDAETGKTGKDVVQIDNTTNFTKNNSTLYVNSTFYDYYTDYELNGNNRKDYGGTNGASQRNWINFRQFDQALSDYYSSNSVGTNNAIYTGHFQPSVSGWGFPFSDVGGTLNLYGWSSGQASDEYKQFMSNNNSVLNSDGTKLNRDDGGDGGYYDYATQDIVSDKLTGGLPTSYNSNTILPYFNEGFLLGNNSKNTKIGDVYHNVAFPFTQKDVNNNGVKYWVFNSADTTLAMKEDKDTGKYFLKDVGNQDWSKNVDSTGTTTGDAVSNTYGFFPFNEYTTAASGKNYNYGFGAKLEFKFRLTNDGTVKDKNNNDVPVEFEFSGDDDVWVFIDDQLVLDVGGDHGRVTGNINFKTLTSTVSKVKKSANNSNEGTNVTTLIGVTSASGSSEEPAVNVLNNTMSGDLPTAANNMSEEHTLTFFYMERGMWESNMKVQFNFPDENQLEVEKVVDKTDVNDMFKDLFDNQSIFDFSIKNLATHYGAKDVENGSTSGTGVSNIIFNENFESGTLTLASGNTFEHIDSWNDRTNVVHWFAGLDDKTGEYRNKRWGTFAADNNTVVDITNMQYLSFKYYYDFSDTPTLNNMYIQIVDADGDTLGSLGNGGDYLSGKTYGSTNMTQHSWQTIKVDLSKLTETGTFDKTRVQYIRFGYNYPRDIYLDDFVFEPSASAGSKLTGFVTKQYDIPDYGSASTNTLKPAAGANYTSSKDDGTTQVGRAYTVDSNGGFALENEETILFRDQFRRGSYISLTENLTDAQKDLFKTSYTVYENGLAVKSFGTGSTVTNGSITSLRNISCNNAADYTANDDRTEQKITTTDADGKNPSDGNAYTGTKPSENTLVFRSYSDPDNETTTTKLKVVYTNKVKTNSLTVTKAKAEGSQYLSDTYTFVIEFSNVGGIGLESEHQFITFTLGIGDSKTIEGIPVGTDYKIYEIKGSDSVLQSVTQDAGNIGFESDTYNNQSAYSVNGTISVSENTTTSYTFSNYKKEVVSYELQKVWVDGNGTVITDDSTLPTSINVQLQRRVGTGDYSAVEGYENVEVKHGYEPWSTFKYTFKDLDKYQNNDTSKPYSYQAVEVDSDGNPIANNGKITIDGSEWTVTYSSAGNSQIITNTAQPTHSLTVRKVDGADTSHSLSGAMFTLKQGDAFVPITKVSDGSYKYDASGTVDKLVTSSDGSFTVEGLPNGEYTLTETQAPGGYIKNDNVYTITFGVNEYGTGTCSCKIGTEDTDINYDNVNNKATLTVSNRQIVLPSTGGTGSGINIVFVGVVLVLIASVGFVLVNRKAFYRKKN